MKKVSEQVKNAVATFVKQKLPVVYLRGSNVDKERIAQAIAAKRGITSGDVCALSCLVTESDV